jgi:type VI secretion system secreted protein Hcp
MAIDSYLNLGQPKAAEKQGEVAEVEQQDSTSSETEEAAVVSPRDAASGLATGKRMHKPL